MRLKVIDYDAMRTAFNEKFKETYHLIQNGETHLDNLAEGFHEADCVIWSLPTIEDGPVRHGKWISVKEQMPESGVHVLLTCASGSPENKNRYVCDGFYAAEKTLTCSYSGDFDAEYDEGTEEYYFPEGWYEVIKNWDDYGSVVIGDFVTHWMPLPEPQEGE